MTATSRDPVLRRKLAPRSSAAAPGAGDATVDHPARDILRSLARAVSDAAPLVVENPARRSRTVSLAELLDSLDPDAFVALLTPGPVGCGLVVVDQSGFTALVEAMTVGRLAARTPPPRRATATDAALMGEVLDAMLEGLRGDAAVAAMRVGRPVPDHRLLPVLLDDGAFTLVTVEAEMVAGGVRRAVQVALALPQPAPVRAADGVPETDRDPAPGRWSAALETAVMGVPAVLAAELGRVTLPLREVLALTVGSALTLPMSALEEVRLVALDGTVQAVGRLGQTRGMRAVRLTVQPLPVISGQPLPSAPATGDAAADRFPAAALPRPGPAP